MVGGGDTFVEDLYFYIGPAAVKRGYHVLIVDLPGQGGLLDRPDVDPGKLAAYGISGGGYLVPRAATREPRLKRASRRRHYGAVGTWMFTS